MATVMVVEDDALICELAGMMVTDWGHEVIMVSDEEEALPILKSEKTIHLLFTDIYLKTAIFGGCQLARQAVQMRPLLRVIYTTGNSMTDSLKAQFVKGSSFVRKPYSATQLQGFFIEALAF